MNQVVGEFQHSTSQPFSQFTDAFPQIAWIIDKNGCVSHYNRYWFDYTGFDPLSWNPIPDTSDVIHPEDLEKVSLLWEDGLRGTRAFDIEHRLRRKDGQYRWHLGRLVSVKDTSGAVLSYYAVFTDIDDRVRAEKKLSDNEHFFKSFSDSLPLMAWVIDLETHKTYYNQKSAEISGYPLHLLERIWRQLIHPMDLKNIDTVLQQVSLTGETGGCEFRFRVANGRFQWHLLRLAGIKNESGKVIKRVGTMINIDHQKNKEENLRRLLMAVPAQVIIYRGPQHLIDFMNHSAHQVNGMVLYSGKTYSEVFGSDQNIEKTLEKMSHVYYSGITMILKAFPMTRVWARTGEPTTRYFDTVVQPTHDADGKVNGLMSFSTEVTQEQQDKELVENQTKWLQAALDSIPVPLCFVDPKSLSVLFTNKASDKMAGFKAPYRMPLNEYSKRIRSTDDGGNPIPRDKSLSARLTQGESIVGQTLILHTPTGRFNCMVAGEILPAMYGHPDTIILTFQDISRLKQIETDLHKMVKSRDELMSICGHELRTPLTALSLQTQLAQKRIDLGDDSVYQPKSVQKLLWRYQSDIDRLVLLIEEMLDLTNLNRGSLRLNLEVIDLSTFVAEILDHFSEQFKSSGCDLSFTPQPDVIGTWDKFRLEQVLINLITNAMRYGKSQPISVKVEKRGTSAFLSVQDHGSGIDQKDHLRIFERFERAVGLNDRSGLGLGLYIVRSIVTAHSGQIHLESSLGEGSKFTVELPLLGFTAEPRAMMR